MDDQFLLRPLPLAVVLLTLMIANADSFAQTFHKTRMLRADGKEVSVDLEFDEQNKRLTLKLRKSPPAAIGSGTVATVAAPALADVPYDAIEKLSYERAVRHRAKDGAGVMGSGCTIPTYISLVTCPASVGVGAGLMLTKAKNHWLYVNYKQEGSSKDLTLKLDKTEYEQVLKTAREQTGKDVATLAPQKGKPQNKK